MAISSFTRKIVITNKKAVRMIEKHIAGDIKHVKFPTSIPDYHEFEKKCVKEAKKALFG